jgi:hypothetical protein
MIFSKPSFYAHLLNGILLFIAFILALNNSKQTILVLGFSIAVGIHGLTHLGLELFYGYNPLGLGSYNPLGLGSYNPLGLGSYNPLGLGSYNPLGLGFNDQTHHLAQIHRDHDLRRSRGCCGCARVHGGDDHTSCQYIRRGSPQDYHEYDLY